MEETISGRLAATFDRAWLHMPGHAGRMNEYIPGGLDVRYDLTELPVTDDLHRPRAALHELAARMSKAAGAGISFPLTGGGTSAVQVMILTNVQPGGKLLMPRTAHMSAWSACALQDLTVVDVAADEFEDGWSLVSERAYIEAIKENPDASAVFVLSPDYAGCTPDIAQIVKAARPRGVRVLVDEAHGAHFPWMGALQPPEREAGRAGADAWAQSAHKTLPALTGAAWLHMRDASLEPRARRMIRMLASTSPSYLTLTSMDAAIAYMDTDGPAALKALKERIDALREELIGWGYACPRPGVRRGFWQDGTRLLVDGRPLGYTGFALEQELIARGVDIEMSMRAWVLALVSVATPESAFRRFTDALRDIARNPRPPVPAFKLDRSLPPTPRVTSVRRAMLSDSLFLSPEEAIGRVAAACVGFYPPGVPFLTPGEQVTEDVIEALRQTAAIGARPFGLDEKGQIPIVNDYEIID